MLTMKTLTRAAAAAAVLAGAIALAGCSSQAESGPVAGTAAPTKSAAAEVSTPTPTATPEAKVGTRANPFPAGTPGQYDAASIWTVTVASTDGDAWDDVQKVNPYNEAPKPGYSDVIGTISVAAGNGADENGVDPGQSLKVGYVGTDANSYDSINHPCGVLADTSLQDAGVMYAGAVRQVLVCAQVPTAAVAGGSWGVTFIDGTAPTAFFAGA
jgi:hypothetical protein